MHHVLRLTRKATTDQAVELLDRLGIANPRRTFDAYPYEVSGGMAQRNLITGAVACDSELLIADEPTTALDVTVQAEGLDLLREVQQERQMGMIIVTHDFGVVADICDRVAVIRTGQTLEHGDAEQLFENLSHPYTKMLLDSTLEDTTPQMALSARPTQGNGVLR